ncbi:MAG: oligosaccharide flippase family protein [Nitrososphaerota archaeon]|jgi:O-antigen/teichoic acid export membrane protein|nr:oligosaccharide flippase family protein [Nitrososphaerota archaeon]
MEDKALQMGKSSTVGSFFLLFGVVGSTVILALGTLILNSLLSDAEIGLYGIVLIPSTVIAYFRDLGVNSAITQKIASLRAEGRHSEVADVVFSGLVFELLSGALLALVCFALAQPLALILNRPAAGSLIGLMSLSIFAGAIVSAASGVFVGFEKMKLNSFVQTLQAIIKTLLGPLLVFLGFSVFGAVLGATVSVIVGGLVSFVLVYFVLFRPMHSLSEGKRDFKRSLSPLSSMLVYGVPLTLSNIVVGVLPQFFVFFMALYAGDSMMGNYFAAAYFAVLVTFISFPISTALFPAFSKLNPEKELKLVKTVFSSSVRYTSIFLIPATMLIITLSAPLVHTLFPQEGILQALSQNGILNYLFTTGTATKFPYAPVFLAVSSIANLFVLFGHVSLTAFQTGIGKTWQIMKQSLLSLAISLPFSIIIIAFLGTFGGVNSEMFVVVGGLLSIMVSIIPGLVWGLIWSWKNYHVKADFKNSAKIFTATIIASIVTYAFSILVNASYPLLLFAGAILFILTYLIIAPLIGAINQADIDNLRLMSAELGIISKFLKIPLIFMQKFCKKSKTITK